MPSARGSKRGKSRSDDRVTMKIDRPLWERMEQLLNAHPEWGFTSVPEFVRRAVDSEIRARTDERSNRVISLCFAPDGEGKRRKGP